MIVEDVDDYAATVTKFRMESLSALSGVWAVLGEGVNPAVQVESLSYLFRVVTRQRSFDKVSHQSAELELRIITGKV